MDPVRTKQDIDFRDFISEPLFWDRVERRGNSDCWPWLGTKLPAGYGVICRSKEYVRKTFYAHRIAYELYHGEAPGKKFVLHSCDNPSCCNPRHLSIGTHKDNMKDMWAKGRGRLPQRRAGQKEQEKMSDQLPRCEDKKTRAALRKEAREAVRIACARILEAGFLQDSFSIELRHPVSDQKVVYNVMVKGRAYLKGREE